MESKARLDKHARAKLERMNSWWKIAERKGGDTLTVRGLRVKDIVRIYHMARKARDEYRAVLVDEGARPSEIDMSVSDRWGPMIATLRKHVYAENGKCNRYLVARSHEGTARREFYAAQEALKAAEGRVE